MGLTAVVVMGHTDVRSLESTRCRLSEAYIDLVGVILDRVTAPGLETVVILDLMTAPGLEMVAVLDLVTVLGVETMEILDLEITLGAETMVILNQEIIPDGGIIMVITDQTTETITTNLETETCPDPLKKRNAHPTTRIMAT